MAALAARSPGASLSQNIPELSGVRKAWWQLPGRGSRGSSLTSRKEAPGARPRSRSETFPGRRSLVVSFPITLRGVCENIHHIPKF